MHSLAAFACRIALIVVFYWLSSCGASSAPRLQPRIYSEVEERSLYENADVIALCRIRYVVPVEGSPVIPRIPTWNVQQIPIADVARLRLWRAHVQVDKVVSGDVSNDIEVYFFSLGEGENRNLIEGKVDRAFLFLKHDGDHWRMVRDGRRSFIPYRRKAIPTLPEDLVDPGDKMAYIMLTPAMVEGPDVAELASELRWQAVEARTAAGFIYARTLTRQLLIHPDSKLRNEACLAVAEWFFGGAACLFSIVDPALQERVEWMKKRPDPLDELNKSGRTDPFLLAATVGWTWKGDPEESIWRALETSDNSAAVEYAKRVLSKRPR